jgi:hypothetical protein
MELDPLSYRRRILGSTNFFIFAALQVLDRHVVVPVTDVQGLALILNRLLIIWNWDNNQRSAALVVVIKSQNGRLVRRPVQRQVPWRLVDTCGLGIAARHKERKHKQAGSQKDTAALPGSMRKEAHGKSPLLKHVWEIAGILALLVSCPADACNFFAFWNIWRRIRLLKRTQRVVQIEKSKVASG